MATIIVLCGGDSDERAVSLRSGSAVADALQQAGHTVTMLDTSCVDAELVRCDVVFPALHGAGGEDGNIQARLEALHIPYVGTGVEASRLCMDKAAFRSQMEAAGFLMALGNTVTESAYAASPPAAKPHVLKPVNGGSSIDTFVIRDVTKRDEEAIHDAFAAHKTMIIEELIIGTEVTVGVLGDTALPIIEIIPPEHAEFDYENKYNGATQELIPPLHVSDADQLAVQELAVRIHQTAGCRDLSRTDFIISNEGKYYLLETNTIPGMTSQSLYPKMGAASGLDMPSLCNKLIGFALARRTS